jgi:hypothetical protein
VQQRDERIDLKGERARARAAKRDQEQPVENPQFEVGENRGEQDVAR